MATEDAKPESTFVTEQETAGEEAHSDASVLPAGKFPREEKKHEESLPENSLMDDKEGCAKVSNATTVTKIDSEILHSGVDVLDETKTKTPELSEMVSIEGDSISPDHVVSKKHDDSEEEQSIVEPEEKHTESSSVQKSPEIIKPADYSHISLPLEEASLEEESPSETHIQEQVIAKHVEEDLNDAVSNADDTRVESTVHKDSEAPKEEISEVHRTDDQNNIPEQVKEDKPEQDLTSSTDEAYLDSGVVYDDNIKEESINQKAEIGNLPPQDTSPSNLTVEEHHGNAEESAKPASTEENGSLREFQSDAQTDEAASEDVREVLEVPIPTASEETKESKEDPAYITNVVPQVSEENNCDQKVIGKENDTIDRDALLRKPGNEDKASTDAMPLGASDISPNEEPQKAIKSEDIDSGLALNDQTTKQEQEDKESITETTQKCESDAETELQDHDKNTDLAVQTAEHHNVDQPPEDSSKEVASLDSGCRSTEAVSETNAAEVSSAEALVDFPEEMPSVKLPSQETTQISSEGTDTEGNITHEATDASFTTSLKEELLQNEGYETAESNISDSPRKSEKIEEPSIEKKTEDAEISGGEHLVDEQNQQATEPLSIEDQNHKSQQDIPTSRDLSEESEKHITAEERDQIEVPELESSLETCQKEEQQQEAAPNADVLQTSNHSKEPETTEETHRLNTEVEIQSRDVNIEEAVKSSSVEERYIPDDALVSHEDSELKVDDTSDELDNVSQTTKLEDTEQVEPNQDLTSSTDEKNMDSVMVDNQNSKEEFINQEAERGNLPPEEVNRDMSPSNLTVEEHHGNAEDGAKPASAEKDGSLEEFQSDAQDCSIVTSDEIQKPVVSETVKDARELLEVPIPTASEETKESKEDVVPQVSMEFQSDAQTDEADEIPKSVVPETVKDDKELLEVSIPTASEETKEDLADITNVVPQVSEEHSHDQEVTEKGNDIIDGDDALLRKPGKEEISQHCENSESEDIDCENPISGLASNDPTTKQEQGDKESIIVKTEKELQDHGKDMLSDSAVQTVEHHNVDQPLDGPFEGKSEKIEESSTEKETEDAEFTGGEHLADEQNQQATEPLSIEDQNYNSQQDIPTSQDLSEHITAKENDIEGKSSAEDSSSDFPEQESSLEIYQKDELEQEAGPNAEVLQTSNQSTEPETTEYTQRLNTEVEIQDKDVNIEEAVKSSPVGERYIPGDALVSHVDSELKVDDVSDVIIDNVSQTTKLEDSIPAEEEGEVDDHDRNSTKEGDLKSEEYPETINSESKIVQMTDSQEMTEENKFIITEEPHTISTPEEKEIYTCQEKEEENTNDIVAGDERDFSNTITNESNPVSEVSEAEIDSNEDTKHVETDVTETTQRGFTAEETIVQTPPEEIKEEKDNGLNTQVSTGVTKDEILETINSENPGVTVSEISEIKPKMNQNENTQIASEESMVEVPPHSTSREITNQALSESNAQVTRSKVESNVEGNTSIEGEETSEISGTASAITKLEENQTSLEDQIEEEPFQVVTAEKTINPTSAEVEMKSYASNSTKEDDLRSEAFTGETKEETIEEPQQILTSEEIGDYIPAKEEGISIIDTTAIDELNQKVSEPETTYDTESFRREMQGGENVVEELPQLSNTEEIVYQPVERKEERTVNDATVFDDERHQEGMVNETSSAHNNSIENIKLEEGMTTEAAWIQTVEAPFQDSSSNKISSQDLSDKDYIEDAAIINEPTVESEATKLEEHKLVDVTQSVGEKDVPAEEVIVDKEETRESIAKVDEMNSESKSKDTRSNVDEMSENIINTDENTKEEPVKLPEDDNDSITEIQNEEATFIECGSREVTNQIDSSSTKIEEKDDLAVLQVPAVVHTPFESSTPVSDHSDVDNMEKEDPKAETDAKISGQEEEMTVIHPKDGDESLQPEVEPAGEVITEEEESIIMQDDSSKEHKNEENFQEQGNMSTQTSVTELIEEEKDQDQNEYQPALTARHDSAREDQSEPVEQNDEIGANAKDEEQVLKQVTSEETIEEPRQISTSEETRDYSPAKEEDININNTTVIDELNQKVLEPETIDDTDISTRQMQGEGNVVEVLPQLSNAVEIKDATILDDEFHQENTVNEISSAKNNLTENRKFEEGIVTEIAHEERTVEVPSHDSSSNKTSSQDLSEKEHNEGALNDTAIDESKTEGSHINDTAEIPSTESEATKLEEDKLIDATQSVGEKDLPAEDSPIVEKAIIYNPDVENEESIAKVDELNSESKSEDTTIEVESEPNLITNEGLSPDSEDREALNNVCDSNMEIEEMGVPEPQTDATISGDNQVPSESLLAESSSDIIKGMEHEDASKAASKECTLNDDDKNEKVEEPVKLSSHENDSTTEIQNEPYFLNKIPTETANQIDSSSTKIEEKDDLEVFQDLAAVHEPLESSTPVSYVDNMDKEDPITGTDAKITGQEEELTIIPPNDEFFQPEVGKNEPEGEVVSKEASIIMQDSSSKEQESESFKISNADQDMEITETEDPKAGIDTKIASEDKIMQILDKSQAGETFQTETENLEPESTSNVEARALSGSTQETSFKDDQMGANAKESVLNEGKEEYIPKTISASKVENEQSLNNRQTDEMLTEGKVPEMLPEIQHGEEAKESMISLEDLLQTSRDVNIKAAENEPTISGNGSKEGDKPYSDEDKADEASDSPVLVEASRDADVKVTPKKSNNILSGVGSKVKNSIAKVKKVITGKSSSPKPSSPT